MSNRQRFKTTLRGKEVDVEMEILSLPPAPIRFSVVFHGEVFEPQPTRQELAYLARAAAKISRQASAQSDALEAGADPLTDAPDGTPDKPA